jgi:hypothetical protein
MEGEKSQYYYTRPSRVYGPVSSATLKRLVESGQIGPDDLVARNGTSKWRVAQEIHGLRFDRAHEAPTVPLSEEPTERSPDGPTVPVVFGNPLADSNIEIITGPPARSRSGRAGFWIAIALGAVTAYGAYCTPPLQRLMNGLRREVMRSEIEKAVQNAKRDSTPQRKVTVGVAPEYADLVPPGFEAFVHAKP